MTTFAQCLKDVRLQLGFTSAHAFFKDLEAKATLDFNYSYYKRFENGEVLPSIKVVNSLVPLLPKASGDALILAYCATAFPNQKNMFTRRDPGGKDKAPTPKQKPKYENKGTRRPQRILTERQISVLAQNEMIYFLFLLLSLTPTPLPRAEIEPLFPKNSFAAALEELRSIKLVHEEDGGFRTSYPEYTFPHESTSKSLLPLYTRLNDFDGRRNKFFGMKSRVTSEMFRRISPRYLVLVEDYVNLLMKTLRMSDEDDPAQNSEVVSFTVNLSSGKLPG